MKKVLGVFLALALVLFTLDNSYAASKNKIDFSLGKKDSSVHVYFVTDWFCGACKSIEPRIEKTYLSISKTTSVSFIDFPINKESHNFIPYNLQFLAHQKGKYLKLRKALDTLTEQTQAPTEAQVQAAVKPYGVKLSKLKQSELIAGMQYNLSIYRGFNLNSTPSVVVLNKRTNKSVILTGTDEITEEKIKSAIANVKN